jgi:hypothetical protein
VGLYDSLKSIIRHNSSTNALSNCWQFLGGLDAHMLRFLENHDEVRFATDEFAGSSEAAIPAMTVSAAMHVGPVMIYNGQEVGERAEGETGFSGDDGRTTIYDYFNMPDHQRWVNDGKFDGGYLSAKQKSLRNFYQKLLNICITSDAISNGKFFDLMYANPYDVLPNRDKVYAWLRYTESQRLLIVTHFDANQKSNVKIRIPDHAFNEMTWGDKEIFTIRGLMNFEGAEKISKQKATQEGISITLNGYDAVIIELG